MRRKIEHISSLGYTLLEVIIALLIFSTMTILAGRAFEQSLRQYELFKCREGDLWEEKKWILLQRTFQCVIPYALLSPKAQRYPYFIGKQNTISYVTNCPIANDLPVIVFLERIMDQKGKIKLVYYEYPIYSRDYSDIKGLEFTKEYRKGTQLIYLSDLSVIDFSFFGYDQRDRQWKWSMEFEGSQNLSVPKIVKISYKSPRQSETIFLGTGIDYEK